MPPSQTDLIAEVGGQCYEKYGVACRRLAPIAHGGEELKETFTRADASTVASYIDRDGFVRRALANTLRVSYELINGVRVPVTLHEASRTNLMGASDAFTNWVSVGTPTVTDAAVSIGGLDLSLVGDDDGAAVEGMTLQVTFTGDGIKAVMVALKAGTTLAADGSQIKLRDTTAPADRLDFTVTWSGGVPTIVTTVGTQLGTAELLRDGVYLVRFQTTSVTAANTHQMEVYPAKTAAQTGNLYIGGVQAENATFPSSLIKTAGGPLTRAADRLEFPFNEHPRAMTIYAHFIERAQPNWVKISAQEPRVFHLGSTSDTAPRLLLFKLPVTDQYRLFHNPAGVVVVSDVDLSPVFGDRIELRAVLNSDGSVQLHGAKNGAAESPGTASAALALASAWSGAPFFIGAIGANGQADIALRSLKIARGGPWTMGEMRTL